MCTGNVYCDEISTQAVLAIAEYLNIQPRLVDEAVHIFEAGTSWRELVAEQNTISEHPQTAYRELRQQNKIRIYAGHACVESEVD